MEDRREDHAKLDCAWDAGATQTGARRLTFTGMNFGPMGIDDKDPLAQQHFEAVRVRDTRFSLVRQILKGLDSRPAYSAITIILEVQCDHDVVQVAIRDPILQAISHEDLQETVRDHMVAHRRLHSVVRETERDASHPVLDRAQISLSLLGDRTEIDDEFVEFVHPFHVDLLLIRPPMQPREFYSSAVG